MNFTVNCKQFVNTVLKMAPGVGARKIEGKIIENCIKITIFNKVNKNGKIVGTMTIFNGSVQVFSPFEIESLEGEKDIVTFFVNSNQMLALGKAYDSNENMMSFHLENNELTIQCCNSEVKLETAEEQPMLTGDKEVIMEFKMNSAKFKKMIKDGGYCYGTDNIFNNIYLEFKENKFTVMSTDGYKVTQLSTGLNIDKQPSKISVLIDGGCLMSIIRLFDNNEVSVRVHKSTLALTDGNTGAILLQTEGNYPSDRLKELIKCKSNKTIITVKLEDFMDGLSVIGIVSQKLINLSRKKHDLIISSEKKGKHTMSVMYSNDTDIDINFSYRFVKDIISRFHGDTMEIIYVGESRPVLFRQAEGAQITALLPIMKV